MSNKSKAQIGTDITGLENLVNPNGLIQAADLKQILNDLNDSKHQKDADIIIISGQSNAVGNRPITEIPAYLRGVKPYAKIWWTGAIDDARAGHFENMCPIYNTNNETLSSPPADYMDTYSGWGPEQECAYLYAGQNGKDVFVIKSALGGASISNWAQPSGPQWTLLSGYINAAITWLDNKGYNVTFKSMLWVQGESDEGSTQAAYYDSLNSLMNAVRGLNTKLSTMQIVAVKIRSTSTGYDANVNAAMQQWADAAPTTNKVIDAGTEDIPLHTDSLHYSAAGLVKLGRKWFDLIA